MLSNRVNNQRSQRRITWVLPLALLGTTIALASSWPAATPRGFDVRYVDDDAAPGGDGTQWATAYRHLHDALTEATTNGAVGEIWVAAGTYIPDQGAGQTPGDREASFRLIPGVRVYGGFAGDELLLVDRDLRVNPTILSGDLTGDDVEFTGNAENSYHVVDGDDADAGTMLHGFVIRGGNANRTSLPNAVGGGMYAGEGAASVVQSVFEWNSARNDGGAVYSTGSTRFIQCVFRWNRTPPTSGGSRSGPGPRTGGAVYCGSNCSAALIDCEFQRNLARKGAALAVDGGQAQLTNCTVSGNWIETESNESAGAGIIAEDTAGTTLQVENSIVSGNWQVTATSEGADTVFGCLDTQLTDVSSVGASIRHSIIDPWPSMFREPLFVDAKNLSFTPQGTVIIPDLGDLRLRPTSPAIDAGNNAADTDINVSGIQPLPVTDLNGLARYVDDPDTTDTGIGTPPIVDVGAYEYQPGDCNYNGLPDFEEVATGITPDCNANGVPDSCDIVSLSRDCNTNGVPDECDIATALLTDLDGNGIADACLRFVDADAPAGGDGRSWAAAYGHLQDALADAVADTRVTEIWVADGTYMPDGGRIPTGGAHQPGSGDRDATFALRDDLTVLGGFTGTETTVNARDWTANATLLSGDLGADDAPTAVSGSGNARHVVSADDIGDVARLDGFVVTRGRADVGGRGAGLKVINSNLAVRNCTFIRNHSGFVGAGVGAAGGAMSFHDCQFVRNTTTSADGCGMDVTADCQVTLVGCTFAGNRRTGLTVSLGASCLAVNSLFVGNWDGGGESGAGGVFLVDAGPSAFWYCTFAANVAGVPFADSVYCVGTETDFRNCVFLGRSGTCSILNLYGGSVSIAQSLFERLTETCAGPGNIAADPVFARAPDPGDDDFGDDPATPDVDESANDDYGDLRLVSCTPGIDAGSSGLVSLGILTDLAGGPRFFGAEVDMGSYESQGTPPAPGDFDGNCLFDLADYAILEICLNLSGPTEPPPFAECLNVFDFDADLDVDLVDFARFQDAVTGD